MLKKSFIAGPVAYDHFSGLFKLGFLESLDFSVLNY